MPAGGEDGMTRRFDEIELFPDSFPAEMVVHSAPVAAPDPATPSAPLGKRILTALADFTLFLALGLVLTPLLPQFGPENWSAWTSFAGFLLLVSFFYFVGSWLIWGRTVGGALFDIRIIGEDGEPATFDAAAKRWLAMLASLLTGGIGFTPALLPSRRSMADRISGTRAITG